MRIFNDIVDEFLAFFGTTTIFYNSKSITLPNVLGLYGLLVEKLDLFIF